MLDGLLKWNQVLIVKFTNSRLNFSLFYFSFSFSFSFCFIFLFSIFRTARVRVRSDWLYCHISYNLIVWSQHVKFTNE